MSTIQPPVPRNADEIIAKNLHQSAEAKIGEYAGSFANTVVLQSKIQAYAERAEVVLSRHVDEAMDHIMHQRKIDWIREGFKIVGSAFVGAFIPGLITSLPANDITATVIYIVLGFIGMLMVFLGIAIQIYRMTVVVYRDNTAKGDRQLTTAWCVLKLSTASRWKSGRGNRQPAT